MISRHRSWAIPWMVRREAVQIAIRMFDDTGECRITGQQAIGVFEPPRLLNRLISSWSFRRVGRRYRSRSCSGHPPDMKVRNKEDLTAFSLAGISIYRSVRGTLGERWREKVDSDSESLGQAEGAQRGLRGWGRHLTPLAAELMFCITPPLTLTSLLHDWARRYNA